MNLLIPNNLPAKNRAYLPICLFLLLIIGCKKDGLPLTDEEELPEQQENNQSGTPPSPGIQDTVVINIGSVSGGNLTIDGSRLSIAPGTVIKIAGATYDHITIKNVYGSGDQPILIKNDGLVTIRSSMETIDVRNIVIAGDGDSSLPHGFHFEDIPYRALVMIDQMDSLTIRNIRFTNVSNYSLSARNSSEMVRDVHAKRFKILNCLFENSSGIVFGGELDHRNDYGLFKDVEIANNVFRNIPNGGSICVFTHVEDFDIHHNIVDNVNQNSNLHNGIFYMQGNGHFHHNKLTNYQGNAIRLWPWSRGNTPKTIEIHHNICYNTRKYSAFEIQAFERNMVPGKTTYVNAKVYNNTVGKMNTSKDWDGQILDLYNMQGGSLEYFNNLGFELYSGGEITDMIHMGGSKITKNSNNVYKSDASEAVKNTIDFESIIPGVGAR